VRRRDVDDTEIQALSGQSGRVLNDLPVVAVFLQAKMGGQGDLFWVPSDVGAMRSQYVSFVGEQIRRTPTKFQCCA